MIFIAAPEGSQNLRDDCRAALEEAGQPFRWHECAGADEAMLLARRAREPVVVVGDDALVNCVINGLVMSGGQAPLGVLSCSERSDFCLSHGIPTVRSRALQTVLQGRTRPLDLVAAHLTGGVGEAAVCYFSAGAHIAAGASESAFSRLAAVWKRGSFNCYLDLDGEKFEFFEANFLLAFQNPRLAEDLALPEAAGGQDGRAVIVLFHGASKARLARLLSIVAQRGELPRENVFARAFTRAGIVNDSKLPVRFGGEAVGFTPMELELKMGALDLIVP